MKYILGMGLKNNYKSFVSLARDIVGIAQHRDPPSKKDRKRKHCWAAVGYNFKSDIIFYDVPNNSNGKMTHQVHINFILEPVVKPWLNEVTNSC